MKAIPPPFLPPPWPEKEVLEKFKQSSCFKEWEGYSISSNSIRGSDSPGGPMFILDLVMESAPSPEGIKYRTDYAVLLNSTTGEVADCDLNAIKQEKEDMKTAIQMAESSKEWLSFKDSLPLKTKITAWHLYGGGMNGWYITYVAHLPDGEEKMLLFRPKETNKE